MALGDGGAEEAGEIEGDWGGKEDDDRGGGGEDGAGELAGLGLGPAGDGFLPGSPPTISGSGMTVIPPSGIVTGAPSTIIKPGSEERRIQLEV